MYELPDALTPWRLKSETVAALRSFRFSVVRGCMWANQHHPGAGCLVARLSA